MVALILLGACAAWGCSRSERLPELDPVADADEEPADSDDPQAGASADPVLPSFPQTGINSVTLTVTGVSPRSGPFQGGNIAVVRGSGFTDGALVRIGGRLVQPRDTRLIDSNSLQIVVPAGDVGPADVTVELEAQAGAQGEDGPPMATRENAYLYNALFVEPASGSIAGGTAVAITAAEPIFDERASVEFGGVPCSELKLVTPSLVRCKTPRGRVGEVDVVAHWPGASGEGTEPSVAPEPLTAVDAFEYLDLANTDEGGLGGGPIEGTINVTVIDPYAGFVIPDAYVVIGNDLSTPHQGRTDSRGQITFSGDDLTGPVTVHVTGKCLEAASIVAFDAQNVTVRVTPLLDPSCAMPGDPPPPGRGTAGSLISGQLIFPGSDEFAVNAWDVIPPPRDNEVRVAYVFTTRVRTAIPNPSPAVGGATARIVEQAAAVGERGYPYRIFARPAGLAVYALSGLERRDTGEFVPYVMGVARDVITAPGEETEGIDIDMSIPLDRELQVELTGFPSPTSRGPDQYRVAANLDLGGEGVIVRQVNGSALDLITQFSAGNLFRFFAQPALTGALLDARYELIAGWYTGDSDDLAPYTEVRLRGVPQSPDPVGVDGFLDIPRASSPAAGERIPADRVLRWQMAEPAPDLYFVVIIGGNGVPAWTQIVPGTQTETPIPDLSPVEEVEDIAPGVVYWTVRAMRIDGGFVYDEFRYNVLSSRFWSHTAIDTFTAIQ